MARPEGEAFRDEFHRRIAAWRSALLGVPSEAAERPDPAAQPPSAPVLSPAEQATFELKRPRSQFFQPIAVGGFASMYLSLLGAPWGPPGVLAAFAAPMGATIAFAVVRRRKQLREATGRILNSAFNLIGLGRLREAEEVLDVVESGARDAWALRLADIQRAIIAIRRGDMAPAEARLTSAIEHPVEGFARDNSLYQLEGARALRAFVRAALGKHEEARADIEAVQAGAPTEDAAARVALAEAMILEQQGKREELRLLLGEKSTLLLEHTHPRERAIVRAFQRMVRADKSSVYRRAEPRREAPEDDEPQLADWVAKVAPGAASFVRSPRAADQPARIVPAEAVAMPSETAVRANREAKRQRKRRSWLPLAGTAAALLAVFGGALAVILQAIRAQEQMAAASEAARLAAGVSSAVNWTAFVVVGLLAMAPIVYAITRGLRWLGRRRAERAARIGVPRAPGRPHAPPGDAQLLTLAESSSPVVAAQACLMLADRAERRADFPAALEAATSGLARLESPRDRAAADIAYPDLISLRAFALAACGRADESNAELATLGSSYPHVSRAVFRARLVTLCRANDQRGALAWIEQGEADLPLSVREELLADLVRATVHPEQAGAGEIQRLKDELAGMPDAKEWVRVVAPGLVEAFEGATVADVRMRVEAAAPEADRDSDHLAEEEAAALEMVEGIRAVH